VGDLKKPHQWSHAVDTMNHPMKIAIARLWSFKQSDWPKKVNAVFIISLYITDGHLCVTRIVVFSDLPRSNISVKGSKWEIWF